MPVFKEIFTFVQAGATWSEVYYEVASNLGRAATFTNSFLDKRLNMLHISAALTKIRVSDVDSPRASVVVPINKAGYWTNIAGDAGPDDTNSAAVINLVSTAIPSSRKIWMRGLGKEAISRNSEGTVTNVSSRFQGYLDAWIRQLQTSTYAVRTLYRSTDVGFTYIRILKATPTPNQGITTLLLGANPLFVAGDRVSISLVNQKDLPGLQGQFAVVNQVGQNIDIQYQTPQNQTINLTTGRVRKALYHDAAIIDASKSDFAFWGSRKTKNVSSGSRGARSARRVRSQV